MRTNSYVWSDMRALFGTVASGQIPPVTDFAFDAFSNAAGSSSGGRVDLSWTHTPVGIPKGVVVLIANENTVADAVAGVTYGGVAMSELSGSPFSGTLGGEENCVLHGFVLTSSVPTGAQTVRSGQHGHDDRAQRGGVHDDRPEQYGS